MECGSKLSLLPPKFSGHSCALVGDCQPRKYITSDFSEVQGKLSPDGKWMAYVSNESGTYEVYVQPFPVLGQKVRVSKGGGTHPHWRRDGKELFYHASDSQLMAVAVKGENHFEVGVATALFDVGDFGGGLSLYPYDVTADGQRFLLLKPVEQTSSQAITVVLNWTAGLKR